MLEVEDLQLAIGVNTSMGTNQTRSDVDFKHDEHVNQALSRLTRTDSGRILFREEGGYI